MEVQIEVQMGKQEEVQMEVEIEIGPYCWNDKKNMQTGSCNSGRERIGTS